MMPFGQFNSVVISVSQNYPLTKVITYQLRGKSSVSQKCDTGGFFLKRFKKVLDKQVKIGQAALKAFFEEAYR